MTNTNTTKKAYVTAAYSLGPECKRLVTLLAHIMNEEELKMESASFTMDVFTLTGRTSRSAESFRTVDFVEWFNRADVVLKVSAGDGEEMNTVWRLLPDLARGWVNDYLNEKLPVGATNTSYSTPFTDRIARFLEGYRIDPEALGKDYKRADALASEEHLLAVDTIAIAKAAVFEGMDETLNIEVLAKAAGQWPNTH